MLYLLILLSCISAFSQVPGTPAIRPASPPSSGAVAPEPPPYKPEELGTIEGIVRSHLTGEPLKKVNILLNRFGDSRSITQPSSTTTNAEGKFALKGLEPGQYRMSAERPGFVRSEYGAKPGAMIGGTTLSLEKGQSMKEIEFRLSSHSVITGRIVDEEGEPVQYATVQLQRNRFFQGRKQLVPSNSASTNDLGEYRIFGIPAGKYYLSASTRNYSLNYAVDRSADPKSEEGYAPTYYPGTSEIAASAMLNVPVGRMLQGMDITLRKVRTLRIKGVVTGVPFARNQVGQVSLIPKDASEMNSFMDRTTSMFRGPRGEFEIRGARPGSYILRADYIEPPDLRFSARALIEITNSNVEGVSLTLSSGGEVQGSLRIEGEASLNLQDLNVFLQPRPGSFAMGGYASARVKEGGAFSIPRVTPDAYTIRVNGLPNEFYLKSARFGDTDILENGLDLEHSSSAGIELVVSGTAANMEGSVVDEKGEPVKGAAVLLRPDTKKQDLLSLLQKMVTTDQNGRFKLPGIAPGGYYLIAFDGVDSMEALDPDLMQQHESAALKVEIKPSTKETRALKVVSLKDSAQ